jgi:hypothetical protein
MERISHVIKHDYSSGKRKATIISLKTDESSQSKDYVYRRDKYINFLNRYSELVKDK